jgi:hypothetical protein
MKFRVSKAHWTAAFYALNILMQAKKLYFKFTFPTADLHKNIMKFKWETDANHYNMKGAVI